MPAPRPFPRGTDDETVLLSTEVIRRAAPSATPPRPGPAAGPAGRHPTVQPLPTQDLPTNGQDDEDDEAPGFSLTATQVVASMSAAVVAAFIGAQLGVAGTVIGAAIVSVVSVVGSAVIGHSLLLTRRKVVQTVQHVRTSGSPADDQETVLLTAVTRPDLERTAVIGPATGARRELAAGPPARTAPPMRRGRWFRPGRLRWVLVGLAASVAVFAGALGAVTVVEAVTGAPISGGSEGGLSVLGGNSRGDDGTTTVSVPSSTATVTATTTSPSATTTSPAPTTTSAETSTSSSVPSTTTGSTAPATTSAPATAPTTS